MKKIPSYHRSIDSMNAREAVAYFTDLSRRTQVMKDQQASYLARRATRGKQTPTDIVYNEYQVLEEELLFLLEQLRTTAEKSI